MSIVSYIIMGFALLFAITVHEAAHGWAANKLGDPTAYSLGRVTLNPIAHIDPVGTIIFPLILIVMRSPFLFGWAKPVPVNPLNLRNPRRDNLWISAAGPISNMTVASLSLIIIVILKLINPNVRYFLRAYLLGRGGLPQGFYPLEGLALILYFFAYINCLLAVFNLIPIPPLDGSGILMGFLSEEAIQKYERIRPFGFIILLALIYFGLLRIIMYPVVLFINAIVFI
jgi:Zn-dependent protease